MTGALIGLAIGNPLLAGPLAFASHFALDAIPHYDGEGTELERISNPRFKLQLLADASLCGVLVLCLALSKPEHWITAAVCAFLATSPDLFWIPKFLAATAKQRKALANNNFFWRFHAWVQWKTGPRLKWVEMIWAAGAITTLVAVIK